MSEAKRFLNELQESYKKLETKKEAIEKLERALYRLSSASYSFTSKGTKQEDTADKLGRIQEEKEKYNTLLEAHTKKVRKLFDYLLEMKEGDYIEVLSLRYAEGKTWQEIIDLMDVSKSKVFEDHKKATRELDKLIQAEKEAKGQGGAKKV